jgi:hypothetical protein
MKTGGEEERRKIRRKPFSSCSSDCEQNGLTRKR